MSTKWLRLGRRSENTQEPINAQYKRDQTSTFIKTALKGTDGIPGQENLLKDLSEIAALARDSSVRLSKIGRHDPVTKRKHLEEDLEMETISEDLLQRLRSLKMWDDLSQKERSLILRLRPIIKRADKISEMHSVLETELRRKQVEVENEKPERETKEQLDHLRKMEEEQTDEEDRKFFQVAQQLIIEMTELDKKLGDEIAQPPVNYGPLKPIFTEIDNQLLSTTETLSKTCSETIHRELKGVHRARLLRRLLQNIRRAFYLILLLAVGVDLLITFLSSNAHDVLTFLNLVISEEWAIVVLVIAFGISIEIFFRKRIDGILRRRELKYLRQENSQVYNALIYSRLLYALVDSGYWQTVKLLLSKTKRG